MLLTTLGLGFPKRFALELKLNAAVNEAIKDGISDGRCIDVGVPTLYWRPASSDKSTQWSDRLRRVTAMSFLEIPSTSAFAILKFLVHKVDVRVGGHIDCQKTVRAFLVCALKLLHLWPEKTELCCVYIDQSVGRMSAAINHSAEYQTLGGWNCADNIVEAHTKCIEG